MGWKNRFTFRDQQFVEHPVGGRIFRFYPNRLALLAEARDLSTPVAKAVSILFADESKDTSSQVKRHHEGEFYMEDVQTQGITTEMASYRQRQRDEAIEQIMGTLADTRSVLLLGKLFMDSLRDEFPYRARRHVSEVEEFLFGEEGEESDYQGLALPALVEMFKGWMKANAKVFGESGESLVGLVRGRVEKLRNVSPSTETAADPTPGDSSKTPSSPQLATDSPPSTSTN